MDDVLLVTADSVRLDYTEELSWLASHDVLHGVTGAHYTRPSLASLLSSNYRSAIESRVVGPTIAEVLSDAGYTCLGYAPNPNTDPTFGFGDGFDEYETFVDPGNVGNSLRQYLSQFDPLRRLYYLLYSPQAKSDNRPSDAEVVDQAIEAFNRASGPRFLWLHLMESHRPYGQGDDATPEELDQKAYFSPEKLTDEERKQIDDAYRGALGRVDENVRRLYEGVNGEPTLLFTADHGESFGETGFYYHRGHARSVASEIVDVPVITDGIDFTGQHLSLYDIGPTLVESLGVDAPDAWHGDDLRSDPSRFAITIAPWHDTATIAWQDYERKIVARDADVAYSDADGVQSESERADVDPALEQQLRDLGYVDAG